MTNTPEQDAILDFVKTRKENLIVKASPGSGKSTTLGLIGRVLSQSQRHAAVCFSTDTADAFASKLPYWVESSTCHKLGKSALEISWHPKPKLAVGGQNRPAPKCASILKEHFPEVRWPQQKSVLALVSLLKQQVEDLPTESAEALADDFGLTLSSDLVAIADEVLTRSDEDRTRIDFDDMLRFPARCPDVRFPPYATILLDEAQDTNSIQRAMLRKLVDGGARLIAVGDEFQAIYGFRGADHDAMDLLAQDFACEALPLSVSWRCSVAVCEEAERILTSDKFNRKVK